MANASEILGDNFLIYDTLRNYKNIKIYEDEDESARFIKDYINSSCKAIQSFKLKYESDKVETKEQDHNNYQKWVKNDRQGNRPKSIIPYWKNNSGSLVELKVNHYRQKFWYWKKLRK